MPPCSLTLKYRWQEHQGCSIWAPKKKDGHDRHDVANQSLGMMSNILRYFKSVNLYWHLLARHNQERILQISVNDMKKTCEILEQRGTCGQGSTPWRPNADAKSGLCGQDPPKPKWTIACFTKNVTSLDESWTQMRLTGVPPRTERLDTTENSLILLLLESTTAKKCSWDFCTDRESRRDLRKTVWKINLISSEVVWIESHDFYGPVNSIARSVTTWNTRSTRQCLLVTWRVVMFLAARQMQPAATIAKRW